MIIELDHFLILTAPGAPEAERLRNLGIIEGTRNDHPGQGTANRRFFFTDAMLELAYIRDAAEATSGPASRLRFVERSTDSGASPFGVIVRAARQSSDLPFSGWRYYPNYFPRDKYLHVGENSDLLQEPLCIYVPFQNPRGAAQPPPADRFRSVTELRISVPVVEPSSVLETIARAERISLRYGEPHLMEIVFNEGKERQSSDLRPELPLVVRW